MNVELNTSFGAKRLDAAGMKMPEGVLAAQVDSSNRMGLSGPSLTVTSAKALLVEAFDEISDATLRRDDDLGQLMTKAFDFQPPEMPNFV